MHSSSPAGQAHELLSQFHAFPACRGNKLSRWSSLPIRLPLSSPRSSCLADSALEDKTSALLALTSTASTIWRNACALDISDQGLWAALVVPPPQRHLPHQELSNSGLVCLSFCSCLPRALRYALSNCPFHAMPQNILYFAITVCIVMDNLENAARK